MDLEINIVLFHSLENIETFTYKITEFNQLIVRRRLELEKRKIIDYLKDLKEAGVIKNINRPTNKKLQRSLTQIAKYKKTITNSLEKIKTIY